MRRVALNVLLLGMILSLGSNLSAQAATREFAAWISAASADGSTFTVHHNATQFTISLRTDSNTARDRVRQAPFADFPSGKKMRFWGGVAADGSTMNIQGIRRAAGDDNLTPQIIPSQNYVGGVLLREGDNIYIQVGVQRVTATLDPNAECYFEEKGEPSDLQQGRACYVRYQEETQGGRTLYIQVTISFPRAVQPPSPSSGVTATEVQQTFAQIKQLYNARASQLAKLMPVTMTVTPELAKVGETVTLKMEALASVSPNPALDFYANFLANDMGDNKEIMLDWKAAGQREGLTVYQAECVLPSDSAGSYFMIWDCDIGGDIPQFSRYYAVIDDSYAVCMFMSTSHGSPRPSGDFHSVHIPFEEWGTTAMSVNSVLGNTAQTWASWSKESRTTGMKLNPMLWGAYWVQGTPPAIQANFQAETPEVQKAILDGYHEMLPWMGFGQNNLISAYTMDNSFSLKAKEAGFTTISSLCSGQNFQDGPMRINHFGMPERPYFVSPEDFRKPGPGGAQGFVGVSQCQRNSFLCREFNCTYSLEPALERNAEWGGWAQHPG